MKNNSPQLPLTLSLSPGFLLLLSAVYFFCPPGTLGAYLLAVLPHELGHVAAISASGQRITGLHFRASGLSLDYFSHSGPGWGVLAALSGPALGLLCCFLISLVGSLTGCDYLFFCAGLGLLLNCFNLLPVLPLDGGVAVSLLLKERFSADMAERLMLLLSLLTAVLLLSLGIVFLVRSGSLSCLSAGIWVLCLTICKKSCPCK